MKSLITSTFFILSFFLVQAQTTYYSTGVSSDWNDASSWTLNNEQPGPAGPPTALDHVVIRHYITHEVASGYTHQGNIVIAGHGSLEILNGFEATDIYQFQGESLEVQGDLIVSGSFVQQSQENTPSLIAFRSGAYVLIAHSLAMEGEAQLIVENKGCGSITVGEDLKVLGDKAQICGQGSLIVAEKVEVLTQSGAEVPQGDPNEHPLAEQICTGTTIFQGADACEGSEALVAGNGIFTLDPIVEQIRASYLRGQVAVNWAVSGQVQNEQYVVERSADGTLFETVAEIPAGLAPSYEALDQQPLNGEIYYRIKQLHKDGTHTYSATASVMVGARSPMLRISPQADGRVEVVGQEFAGRSRVQLTLRNLLGQVMYQSTLTSDDNGRVAVQLAHHMEAGTYLLSLQDGPQIVTGYTLIY